MSYERVKNKLVRIGAALTGKETKIAKQWDLDGIEFFLPDPDENGNYDIEVLNRIMAILEYYGIDLLPLDYN